MQKQRGDIGFSIVECVLTLAMISALALISTSALDRIRRSRDLAREAERVRQYLVVAQSHAQSGSQNCGVFFYRQAGEWMCALYRDGDGDGIRRDDILSGTDPRIASPSRLVDADSSITIGIPDGFTDPDTMHVIPRGSSPIDFNRSFICSFSPGGSGTPGSIYLTDGGDLGAAVRCSGSEGFLRKLYYAGAGHPWKER